MRERANAFDKFRSINRVSRAAKGERVREWKNRWAKNRGRRGNRGGGRGKEEGQIERQPEGDGDRNSSMDN